MAATVGAKMAPSTAITMSAASTTGHVGMRSIATAAAANIPTPATSSPRLYRVASMNAPIGTCSEMPISPLIVSTAPICAWFH
jgi:hypothetical protein